MVKKFKGDIISLSLIFDQVLLEEYKQNVSTLMKDWESFKGTQLYMMNKGHLAGMRL